MPDRDMIPLWPDGLPDNDIQHAQPEQTVNRDIDQNEQGLNRAISSVIDPGLFVYPANSSNSENSPNRDTATGDVILVCPGGGYHHVTVDKEGHDVAVWLNSIGISAVVLKYRTRPEGYAKTKAPDDPVLNAILRDGQEAMRVVRDQANAWGIKLTRLGAMGFSAGAHLAIRLAMTPDARPDFLALLYSSVPANAGDAVTQDWPTAFIAHANDDTTTPAEGILDLYTGYRTHNLSTEMHIYPEGGHAFGLGVHGGPVADWTNRFADWIQRG
jgi:acetyl esterase/lipase